MILYSVVAEHFPNFRIRKAKELVELHIRNGMHHQIVQSRIVLCFRHLNHATTFFPVRVVIHSLRLSLELAYMDARSDANINQLLLIPCVILDFLCIHPFRDGNGRMSRLLSLLLLYKSGFDAGKYVSFEEQINNYKTYYYEALRQSSAGWDTNENSYFPFIENFLSTLYMCYKELDKRFAVVHGKRITKKARVEATVLNSLTPLSKADICKILPDVSPTTVEAVLGAMIRTGSVKRIGAGRATRYIKA